MSSVQPRHIVAALVAAFIIGIVGGGIGAFSGGGSAAFEPAGITAKDLRDEAAAAKREAEKAKEAKAKPDQAPVDSWTAQAVFEKSTGRIVISGLAAGLKPGTKIIVQRKQSGSWSDFPAQTTIGADGSYSVWVKTSRTGENTFRVADTATGEASEPATISV
ncbi:MAG: hypothetical protein ACT4P1_04895 [Sporichthyaceae bacterium]